MIGQRNGSGCMVHPRGLMCNNIVGSQKAGEVLIIDSVYRQKMRRFGDICNIRKSVRLVGRCVEGVRCSLRPVYLAVKRSGEGGEADAEVSDTVSAG